MYNGIGLTTARGSGTNGYVQTNKFFVRPKTTINNAASGKAGFEQGQGTAGLSKKPNKEILEHDRKRQIELKLVVLEDKLADQGYTDTEISEKISEAREKLEEEAAAEMGSLESDDGGSFAPLSVGNNKVSDTQTHQVAARKEKQMEKLRAALGIVPEAQPKKDENLSNLEETNDDQEISDSLDKDLNDDGKFHSKGPKNRNVVTTKAVKKHESDRDAIESRSLEKQQDKELGELSDSFDTETEEKHLEKKFPKHPQQYHHQRSESESESDEKMKKSSKGIQKDRRHGSDDSDSDDGKYVKGARKAQDKRTRRHDSDESESDYERYGKSNRKHDKDVSKSEAKYEKHIKSDDKKKTLNKYDSDDEKYSERHEIYESERHEKSNRKHSKDVSKSESKKYEEVVKNDEKKRTFSEDDSDYEKYGKSNRKHDKDVSKSEAKYEKNIKRDDKKRTFNEYDSDDEKYCERREIYESERHEKSNNKHSKDVSKSEAKKYEEVVKTDDKKRTFSGDDSEDEKYSDRHEKNNRKHGKDVSKSESKKYEKHVKSDDKKKTFSEDDSEDEKYRERHAMKSRRHSVDRWNHKNDQKTGKHNSYVRDNSEGKSSDSDGTDGSDSDYKDYKRKKVEKEKNRGGVGVDISTQDRKTSSVIEKCMPKKVDDKNDTLNKLEELYGSTRDTSGNREMMKGKRKLEDGFNDDQPETKFRKSEVTDKGFEEKNRSSRHKDADLNKEHYSRGKNSGDGHDDKYGEISRRDIRDDKKEEREGRIRNKDADLDKEHYSRGKKSGDGHDDKYGEISRRDIRDDKKEEREGRRYSRNDDVSHGMVRHSKDEGDTNRKSRRDDTEGEHRSNRRREREEEEHTSGRDGKSRLEDSSKRAKYDDYRSEEKRRYDGDKRDDRDALRSRRRD